MITQHEGDSHDKNSNHYGSILDQLDEGRSTKQLMSLVENGNHQDIIPHSTLLLEDDELLLDELAGMTKLAIPVIITYLLEMFPGLITIILVGRVQYNNEEGEETNDLSKMHLDAASFAVMFMNVTALSPAFGILTAMDTLCSQAHGAGKPQLMGTYSITGISVISFVFLLSSIAIWNTSYILIQLGQPKEVSQMAGKFIMYMLPGIPFLYLYELIRKVGQARNEATPMLISTIICNFVNVTLGYLLVHYTHFGWIGAAIARSIGNMVTVPTIITCMMIPHSTKRVSKTVRSDEWETQHYLEISNGNMSDTEHSNNDDDKDNTSNHLLQTLIEGASIKEGLSFKAIAEFLKLGIPGMCQTMFEWIAFEFIALLCGILPGKEAIIGIGANSIVMNFTSLTYMLYLGVSVSGNVRVGNALGANDSHRAEIASYLTIASGFLLSIMNTVILLRFRKNIPYFFTTDRDIVEKAQHLCIIAAIFSSPGECKSLYVILQFSI